MSDLRRQQVQYLEEKGLVILTKKDDKTLHQKLPPKIKGKHFSNLEYLAEADLVWLTPDDSNSFPSYLYDPSRELSYFDQCFSIFGKLGEGSFGSVLKVVSNDNDKGYALKVSKEPFKSDYDRAWKLHEVEHHKRLSGHECIVSLHQAWEEDRYTYMLMELCKHNMAQARALPEELCWQVLVDITLALDYIHDLGMGHFDVKLENILYGVDGRYKLSDFGLVYDLQKPDKKPPNEGDAKYLAPELLTDEQFTVKADIFSLGISILELAGNLSLPTNGPVWNALRENTFPLAQTQNLSDGLFFLLVRMMSPDASFRPSAKEILDEPHVKAVIAKRNMRMSFGKGVAAVVYRSLDTTVQLYMTAFAAIGAIIQLVTNKVLGKTVTQEDRSSGSSSSSTSAAMAISGRQPLRSAFTSTPYYESDNVNNNNNVVYKQGVSLNSQGSEVSFSSLEDSVVPFNQVSVASDWISMSPGSSPLRRSPLQQNTYMRYSSPAIKRYGISPIRMSQDLKAVVKARKAERKRKVHLLKRNLHKMFDEEEPSSSNHSHIMVNKRQRMMRPRNLTTSFDDEFEV